MKKNKKQINMKTILNFLISLLLIVLVREAIELISGKFRIVVFVWIVYHDGMNEKINSRMGVWEWLMLVTLSVVWGGSFFFVAVAVEALPPLTIVTLRVLFAAATLWAVLLALGYRPPREARVWGAFFIMGGLNNVLPFSLIVWGQTHIASGLASILNATMPLFTVVIAGALLPDEKMTRGKIIGVLVGFVGVVVLVGPTALDATTGTQTLAQLAVLAAAMCYGFAGTYGRRFRSMGVPPMVTAAGQVTASSLLLLPVAFVVERPDLLPPPAAEIWLAVVALAVFSTALAYILYFRILSSAGATNISLVTFLVPVSAIALGVVVLDERLLAGHIVGMAFIGLGLSCIDGRLWKRR